MKTKKIHFAWIVLIGVIIIRGFAGGGLNNIQGLFLGPVSQDIGVGVGQLSVYLSITSLFMLIWLPVAGKLMNKYDVRIISILGIILQAGSFIGFGFMNSVWGWYILSVPHAMGVSILSNLLGPILINRWFNKNTGLILGIHMCFVGLFSAVLQPLTTSFIGDFGWRFAYKALGGIAFVAVLLSIFFIRSYPKDKNLKPYGYKETTNKDDRTLIDEKQEGISLPVVTKSASFFLLIIFVVALTGFAVFVQHVTTYGLQLNYALDQIGIALAMSSIGTAIGSIAIGILSDKIGVIKTSIGIIIIGFISAILYLISGTGFIIFNIATFLHGLANSSISVLTPILTLKFYGKKDYEKIYSLVMTGAPLAAIILLPAYGFIYDFFGGYAYVLIFLLIVMVVALISIIYGWRSRCKLVDSNKDKQ